MKSEIKDYVSKNFNDPKSYELIEFKVVDSITPHEIAKISIEDTKMDLKMDKESLLDAKKLLEDLQNEKMNDLLVGAQESYNNYKLMVESDEKIIKDDEKKLNNNDVYGYVVLHKFRAKNAMGALLLQEKAFLFDKENKLIGMYDYDNLPNSDLFYAKYDLINKKK